MGEKAFMDVFKLCWNAIFDESFLHDGVFFNSEHCKIRDSIDTNFDIPENRLAFAYKYGSFNLHFFEKCFLNFLNEYPDFETVFPLKNLKVCSLSNGPGFDIVGMLCALCVSNKFLKSVPKFSALNLYYSWYTLYETLIYKAYSRISLKFTDSIQIKRENIHLIQGDIFLKTLSPETKNCISSSNVLLMVKVFFCSKVTTRKFTEALKKIFLLLKPGALIFFIGSESNMNTFSRRRFLSNYVKTIYGPQKVTLDTIVISENFSNVVGQKPVDSGSAHFVVWQKRNSAEIGELIKDFQTKDKEQKETKKPKRKPRKKKATLKEQIGDAHAEISVDSDDNYSSDSEISCTTNRSTLSDVSTKYSSSSNLSDLSKMKSEVSSVPSTSSQCNSGTRSIENIISILDQSDFESVKKGACKTESFQHCSFQYYSDNASGFKDETCKETSENISDKKFLLNYACSSSYYASDKANCELMKQAATLIEENVMPVVSEASNLSYVKDIGCCNDDLMKQESSQVLNDGVSVVHEVSSSSYSNDKGHCDLHPENTHVLGNDVLVMNDASSSSYAGDEGCFDRDLIKQKSNEILDKILSAVNDASNLSYDDGLYGCDHDIKKDSLQVLGNMSVVTDVSSSDYANDKGHCNDKPCCYDDDDLLKRENTQVSDMSIMNDASSLMRLCDHGLMNQENAQVLDRGISMENASNLNCDDNVCNYDYDITKQESSEVLMSVVNDSSSLKYANNKDRCEHDLMKQETTQVIDNCMSLVDESRIMPNTVLQCIGNSSYADDEGCDYGMRTTTEASNLSYAVNEDHCGLDLMKQVLDDVLSAVDASSLSSVNVEGHYIHNLMKQTSTNNSDNDFSAVNDASSYVIDKDHCHHDHLINQVTTQVLDDGRAVKNDISSYASEKDHCHNDLMKQESTRVLDNGMSIINEVSELRFSNYEDANLLSQASAQGLNTNSESVQNKSSSCANNKDNYCDYDLMKQATAKVLDNTQRVDSNLNFKHTELHKKSKFPLNTYYTDHDIPTDNSCNIRVSPAQSVNKITSIHEETNARKESEKKSRQNLSSLKQHDGNILAQEKNVQYSPEDNILKPSEDLNVEIPRLHPLIRQCEHLVTELEKMIISLKRDSHLSSHHRHQILECSPCFHHCGCHRVKIVHTCCCHQRRNK